MSGEQRAPLVVHILYSFHIGGLENGVVNLINHMPPTRYRHVVIALADVDEVFRARIVRSDVEVIALNKPPGHGVRVFRQMYTLLRQLRPDIVHTRNLAALEMVIPAWLARVPVRIHGEHGWDSADPDGRSKKYRLLRRLYSPFVTHYIALSGHLSSYLTRGVGVAAKRISRICNGVDLSRFNTASAARAQLPAGFRDGGGVVFGTVGRLQPVKDQRNLIRALAHWRSTGDVEAQCARLVIVGDGPMRAQLAADIEREGLSAVVWLTGARDDVPALMNAMDCFVLPSQAEGISNTLLEAMASGLPTVATRVGGNVELVAEEDSGLLVAPEDPGALAAALARIAADPAGRRRMGEAARQRAMSQFSLETMVDRYLAVYDQALGTIGADVALSNG
ncbi:MAG: sugar transferase [Porticoccaceae bacterium]|nr:sugar transferase [Porticoccaceae bacterium]